MQIAGFVIAGLWLAAIGGWVSNIVQLVSSQDIGALFIFRCIGIFIAPVGVVLGYV